MTHQPRGNADARRFAGAVYDDAHADLGLNATGERVVRLDLTYGRGPGAVEYTLILALNAAITLRNQLDDLFDTVGIDPDSGGDVEPEDACPRCGERKQDQLVWVQELRARRSITMHSIGKRVRILGGMQEFIGQTGTIVDAEDSYYRVQLDTPVDVPGVGLVYDDLWQGHLLQPLRATTSLKKHHVKTGAQPDGGRASKQR